MATAVIDLEQVGHLLVDKSLAENNDADTSGDISVGDVLTFAIEITNDGNVTLDSVTVNDVVVREGDDVPVAVVPVVDDQGTPDPADDRNVGDTNLDGLLDVGETWLFEAVYTVADADSFEGQVFIQNVAVAMATTPAGEMVKAADGLVLAGGQGVGSPGYWKNHPEVWMDANGDGIVDDDDVLVIGDWDGDGTPDGQGFTLTTTEALQILDASQSQKDRLYSVDTTFVAYSNPPDSHKANRRIHRVGTTPEYSQPVAILMTKRIVLNAISSHSSQDWRFTCLHPTSHSSQSSLSCYVFRPSVNPKSWRSNRAAFEPRLFASIAHQMEVLECELRLSTLPKDPGAPVQRVDPTTCRLAR